MLPTTEFFKRWISIDFFLRNFFRNSQWFCISWNYPRCPQNQKNRIQAMLRDFPRIFFRRNLNLDFVILSQLILNLWEKRQSAMWELYTLLYFIIDLELDIENLLSVSTNFCKLWKHPSNKILVLTETSSGQQWNRNLSDLKDEHVVEAMLICGLLHLNHHTQEKLSSSF